MIAQLLPCVDSDVAEKAFSTIVRERDRLTADLTRPAETRDALDAVIQPRSPISGQHRREAFSQILDEMGSE